MPFLGQSQAEILSYHRRNTKYTFTIFKYHIEDKGIMNLHSVYIEEIFTIFNKCLSHLDLNI